MRRLEYANEAIGYCRMENLMAAGIVSSSVSSVGIMAGNGLFCYEVRADARFSLTVQAGDATGWSAAAHRSATAKSFAFLPIWSSPARPAMTRS